MGDLNSRMGKDHNEAQECMDIHGKETKNKNGMRIIDFFRENDFVTKNIM